MTIFDPVKKFSFFILDEFDCLPVDELFNALWFDEFSGVFFAGLLPEERLAVERVYCFS